MADYDIKTLPKEAQDYIASLISEHDRKVNELSQGNRKEAVDKLKADPAFLASVEKSIRAKIEAEAKQTAEEKAQAIMEEADKKLKDAQKLANSIAAKEAFQKAEINSEEYADFLDLLVTDDEEASTQRVSKWIDAYNKGVNGRLEKEKQKLKGLEESPTNQPNNNVKKLTDYSMAELNQIEKENPQLFQKLLNS